MKLPHAAELAMILIASNVFALTGAQYLPQPKVQLVDARRLALKAYRGKIISEELEQEGAWRQWLALLVCSSA